MNKTAGSALPKFAAPDDGRLTDAMLAAYRRAGVIILENFVTRQACEHLRRRALELVDAFDPAQVSSVFSTTGQEQLLDRYFIESGDQIRFFLEADAFDSEGNLRQPKEHSLNKMGHAMHDLDPVFEAFSHSTALANVTQRLGFVKPGLIQSMYIFKPPRIGGEVVCHQDSTYLYTDPESCVGFWFALEDATIENGCMYFIPGQHTASLKALNYRSGAHALTTKVLDPTPWPEHLKAPAEAPQGSLVVFHGRAPHLSGPNRSERSRHAYTLHVIDQICHYPAANWLQRGEGMTLRGFA